MREKIDNKYFYWGITFLGVITASIILFFTIYRWKEIANFIIYLLKIFTPIFYGLLMAYIFSPMLKFLEEKYFSKFGKKIFKKNKKRVKIFSRTMSISISGILFFLMIFGVIKYIIPEMFKSINMIIVNTPLYIENVKEWLINVFANDKEMQEIIIKNYDNATTYLMNYINNSLMPSMNEIISQLSNSILGILKFIFNLILGFMVAIYVLIGKDKFIAQAKKMMYAFLNKNQAKIVLENVRYAHKMFGSFLYGKVIDSLIIGIICFIFMIIFKMPYAILIAVIVGVTNIIPYFGPFIGAIPSALLILLVSPTKCLTFVIFIIILQQFDGNILEPKILGSKTGLKSFWVLFAILIFGGLFGFLGMLFGVPLFAIIYTFINGICERRLYDKNLPINTNDYVNVDFIDDDNEVVYFR